MAKYIMCGCDTGDHITMCRRCAEELIPVQKPAAIVPKRAKQSRKKRGKAA